MKNRFVVFTLICFLLGGCFPKNTVEKVTSEYEGINTSDENVDHIDIYNKRMDLLIKDKIVIPYSFEKVENEKDKYYLYFGRNDCPYCQDFLPELYNLADRSEVKLYYVDTNIKNEQLDELLEKFNVEYVPTLIKIDKGKSIIFDFTEDELGVFID